MRPILPILLILAMLPGCMTPRGRALRAQGQLTALRLHAWRRGTIDDRLAKLKPPSQPVVGQPGRRRPWHGSR